MFLLSRLTCILTVISTFYCVMQKTVAADRSNENSQSLSGLLNIIRLSSGRGEPTINAGGRRPGRGQGNSRSVNFYRTTRFDNVGSMSTPNTIDDIESDSPYSSGSSSSEIELPDPVFLARNQIQTRIKTEQNRESSHVELKELRKAEVKALLLRKLQLQQLPQPKMADLYRRFPAHLLKTGGDHDRLQMDAPQREDNYHIKIQQMIRFAQQMPTEKKATIPADRADSTMYFPLPFTVTEGSIRKATLLVYLKTPDGYEGQTVTLTTLSNQFSKQIAKQQVTLPKGEHWQHVDITDECRSWLKHEWKNNLGLVAEAQLNGVNLINYNNSIIATNDTFSRLPLVKLELSEEHNRRNKRSLSSDLPLACDAEDNERRCCKYPFVLDFDELGTEFKFILSPKRYYANYCKGTCPEYVIPTSANLQLTRGLKKAERCCTPSEVKPLNLVYLNEESVIMEGVIPGMSISACDCD